MEEQFLPSLFAITLLETPSLFQTAILSLSNPLIFLCFICFHLPLKLNILHQGVAIGFRT